MEKYRIDYMYLYGLLLFWHEKPIIKVSFHVLCIVFLQSRTMIYLTWFLIREIIFFIYFLKAVV